MKTFNRREFISGMLATGIVLQIPGTVMAMFGPKAKSIKAGLITDLHQDVIHNGSERLQVFLTHMKKNRPDFIMQMGDFAYPNDKNKALIDEFNQAHPVALHVIGNHDTDSGHTKEQCLRYWKMPARYYTKEINGVCFIILDGNDKGSPTHKGGYPSYINDEQKIWLQQQLRQIEKPIVIVCHQPLAGALAVDNAAEIQDILGAASDKILLAINGHTHIDCQLFIKGINYVHINSASYFWVGDKYKHNSYPEEVHKAHPWISYTCPYQDALFTTLTIDPSLGIIHIEGKKSNWVGQSPEKLNYVDATGISAGKEIVPFISKRKIVVRS
ncbi:alkaline phosphatase [Pedobacter sp. HMWF019]|uniref:metallophosphoesterase family protein n=1 Tax=Pedobacter sp. HMWF019 TaxID=2056856 RepID=UPI000D39E82F|nr:metallophosphoesterase [Pedobacter sp. HMWF019]PTS97089.1 alkaline phosphatase [Pedobacter sp. HMWF019]